MTAKITPPQKYKSPNKEVPIPPPPSFIMAVVRLLEFLVAASSKPSFPIKTPLKNGIEATVTFNPYSRPATACVSPYCTRNN